MNLEQKLCETLTGMLKEQQLSISAISRLLKKGGCDQHRLILTGYLRALRDIGHLIEEDVPPSKVYSYNSKRDRDIYSLVGERIASVDANKRFAVGVCVLQHLFNRPCFKQELKLIGLTPTSTEWTQESKDPNVRKYRELMDGLNILSDEPAYEFVDKKDNPITEIGAEVLAGIIREIMDLSGLYLRYQQMKLIV
ncbi:MAG: hypothetical protein PHD13_07015 [Methanocellales archaeon]|nr:hypothetical protein [Methanocellales archaeon]MDD3292377.1 hypothetical protein [Methanocellales archaeon]MDD5235910.1 hypothetical protein [Methanocellales archaeon]MDD5485865.1 hypothetical protein [Methanocellales archaeon]